MGDPALSKTQQQFKRSRPASLLAGRSYRFATAVAVAAIVIATAPPAFGGMCDQPPFGVEHFYDELTVLSGKLFGDPASIDYLLHNICRAKYMHDAKMRKTLRQIGLSDELIDGNDVGYTAIKVLQAGKECILAHPNDASKC